MVHYDRPSNMAPQNPPPICPKCGSHRTEIVGVGGSQDGRTFILRCNSCGERSTIPAGPPVGDTRPDSVSPEEVTAELEALQAVGQALANLGNPESRQRVLRWASERFQLEPLVSVPVMAVGVAEAAAIVTEPNGELSLEGVADLFGARGHVQMEAAADLETLSNIYEAVSDPETLSKIYETPTVVVEPAAIATQTRALSLEGVADLFDEHDEFDADEDLVVQPTAPVAAVAEDQGLGSLLDGLVADFQRIALDCQAV